MELNKYCLGDLITQRREKNPGGNLPIRGVTKEGLKPPKQIDADTSIYNLYYRNDFVYNPARMELGSIAFNDEYDKAICSSLYEVFYVHRTDLVIPEYLALFVKHPEFARYCNYLGNGSAREYCRFDSISRISISLPPISEQRKIVHDYQVITGRIELMRKMNENLEEQVSLHFENTFGHFIPDGLNVSETIPDGWTVATVGDFCKTNSATFSGEDNVLLYLDTGSITNNYISGLQVLNTDIDEIPSRARRKVSNGDIVYSTVRPNLRHYGIIFNPPANMIVSTGFAVMSMLKNAPICSEIIYLWLTRDSVVNVLHSIAENSVSTYPSIVSADLEQIKMVVPTENECINTGAYYKSVFQTIDCNNREISKLEKLAVLLTNKLAKGA